MIDHNIAITVDDVLIEPRHGLLFSRTDAKLRPFLFNAPMDTVGGHRLVTEMLKLGEYGVLCRNIAEKEWVHCVKTNIQNPNFWIAVGSTKEHLQAFFSRLELADVPDDVQLNLVVDIAHGDSAGAFAAYRALRELPMVRNLMSGSVATFDAARRVLEQGCTHIRVGIGPGSACTTRLQTGVGVPQLHAIVEIHQHLLGWGLRDKAHIIADGGIRSPGDAAKYLCGGADSIMMGRLFAAAEEAPGWEHVGWIEAPVEGLITYPRPTPKPRLIKQYRGHASAAFQQEHFGTANRCPEGASLQQQEWDGTTVQSVVEEFRGGISSCISYTGHRSIDELRGHPMRRISSAARAEGETHG